MSAGIDRLSRFLAALSLAAVAPQAGAENYSDIWWNPQESGWGVTIADHETNVFAVLYAYRSDRRPVWYTVPGGVFSQGRRIFQGDVYGTRGPSYTSVPFNPNLVTVTKVGTATFDFTPPGLSAGTVLLTYTINGVNKTKQILRQGFGNAAPNWGTDRTDLWFNPAASGWGLALAHHGNNMFGVWYTYDTDGEPLWFVLPGGSFSGMTAFAGSLYRTTGPYFGNATFDPTSVVATNVGTAAINFQGSKSSWAVSPKDQEACPGFGANFVATFGDGRIPLLACRQPFGNQGPGIPPGPPITVATTCTGPYMATTTIDDTSHCTSARTRSFSGTFKVAHITWAQTTVQAGTVQFQHFFFQEIPDSCSTTASGTTTCNCHDEYSDDELPLENVVSVPNADGTVHGTARVDLGFLVNDMTYQVFGTNTTNGVVTGGTTVRGTMAFRYQLVLGAPVYSGQGTFNCTVQ